MSIKASVSDPAATEGTANDLLLLVEPGDLDSAVFQFLIAEPDVGEYAFFSFFRWLYRKPDGFIPAR